MASQSGDFEPGVAERETQRAAEQEALRNVRSLTDALEKEQRERRRLQKWGLVVAALALLALLYAFASVYLKGQGTAPAKPIEVPGKVVLPKK